MENENLNVIENKTSNVTNTNNTKSIIAILAIAVLFLGLLFVTFSYFNSPKKRMVSGINKVFSTLTQKESNEKITNIFKNDIVGVEGETTLNLSGSEIDDTLKLFDNTVIKYNYIEDKKNKTASINLNSSINNEKLLELYGLAKDDKMYINFKNLINKYYHMEYIFTEILAIDSTDDAEYVLNILKDTIIESLDNDDFSKTKTSMKIDGEMKKVEKMSFKFTDKNIVDVMVDFVEKIKNDEKALKILVEYNNITKEELVKQLDEIINNSKEVINEQEYVFNMYVKDYIATIKYELEVANVKIAYYNYNDNKEFSVSSDGIKYLNVKVKDDKVSGNLAMIIPFEGTYKDGKLDLTLSYMTTKYNLVINTEEKYESDSYETNYKIEINVKENNTEYLKLSINSKNTISKYDKINEFKVTPSTDIDNMSEEDIMTIMNKLSEMTVFKKITETYEQNKIGVNGLKLEGTEDYITF